MHHYPAKRLVTFIGFTLVVGVANLVQAAPSVLRLTPPSQLFVTHGTESLPMIARFIPGQRFDLQVTASPENPRNTIKEVVFKVDDVPVPGPVTLTTTGLVATLPANTSVATHRAYANSKPGIHTFSVTVTESDNSTREATGNFEVVPIKRSGPKVKNVIILLGDGMGAGHRTAARIMLEGIAQGKAKGALAMDTFPFTGQVMTASLNSIVTDSAPGMANYVTGNKAANNQEGVWPDDTLANFDNPRVEYLAEFLARTQRKKLGLVTTADVFDATPAANAVHTQARGAGTGIVDQYFDDRALTGLTVLMGGGRKWFLPNPTQCPTAACEAVTADFNGSARENKTDYVLPPEVVTGWGAAPGAKDAGRDLISAFQGAGWSYAPNKSALMKASDKTPLLGLFALSNMNVALDKIGKRRGTSTVVDDYGFPDQPMLDEMTNKALAVLDAQSPHGFVLMVEGASIDKQAHSMDSERFILDTIEFDRAVNVAKRYALAHPDTLVIVTADHECGGVAVIGAAKVDTDNLLERSKSGAGTTAGGPRNGTVGVYEAAGFPHYTIAADGYPASTDPDRKMLIGYAATADRGEDWLTNPRPLRDVQQPGDAVAPLNTYPALAAKRDAAGGYLITGQVEEPFATHTGNDIPLSAMGRGASLFTGTFDNTEVFFKIMQAVLGGVPAR